GIAARRGRSCSTRSVARRPCGACSGGETSLERSVCVYRSAVAPVFVDPRKVREFADQQSFYDWLGAHWDTESELWIKIHKTRSGLASITPAQAIDVVLCWGWIDGIRKGFDATSFLQRYTPRGKKSVWSKINIANVDRLIAAGRMRPSGLAQ